MSVEKQNDPIDQRDLWRVQLDQLKLVPGQNAIDKDQAWKKLYDRLKEQSHPRKYPIYWIAAACLCCLFFPLGIKILRQEDHAIKKMGSGKHSAAVNASPVFEVQQSPGHASPKNEIIRNLHSDQEPVLHASHKFPAIAIQEKSPAEISAAFSIILARNRVAPRDPLVSGIRKVLPVIPLNESGLLLDPNYSSAHPSYKLKIYNPANLDLPSFADEPQRQPAVKIKLAAQN